MALSASPLSYKSHSFSHHSHQKSSSPRKSSKTQQPLSKLSISAPISAHPSRQSSTSSLSSTSSTSHSSSQPQPDLSTLALRILHTLYNAHNPQSLTLNNLIHPSATFTHEYLTTTHTSTSLSSYITHWETKLSHYPSFSATVRECCVDDSQGKVWIQSDVITGRDSQGHERRRQVVDMLTFDSEGRCIGGEGFFRRMSSRPDED